jgi:hypothetical protein
MLSIIRENYAQHYKEKTMLCINVRKLCPRQFKRGRQLSKEPKSNSPDIISYSSQLMYNANDINVLDELH